MSKPVILTGIRANSDLQIGNYFGAILPIIKMARERSNEYQVNLFVPDLHSFTTPVDHKKLFGQIMNNLKIFVAAGLPLDHPDIHIYRQSYIPAHSEMTWILDCFTGFGEMSRMTQFKDKSSKLDEDRISVGLFNYPVLMAADILLYGASYVPVGDDQSQHIEFTRDIAERMNARFGRLFVVPKTVAEQHEFFGKSQGLRIRNLIVPEQKMGKSDDEQRGVLYLTEDPMVAAKKIMSATTDSLGVIHFDREKQPGISNLLEVLALVQGRTLGEISAAYDGKTSYGELKKDIAEHVQRFMTEFQERLAAVDEKAIQAKLETSEAAMREVANKTLLRAQRAVGLRPQSKEKVHVRAGRVAKPSVISFEDFARLDIRIGKVIAAESAPESDKLIKLTIDLGAEQRTIVTGMREFYSPESFVGKMLPILANLKSQSFRGEISRGMLMAVEGSDGPVLLLPERNVPEGSPVE